MTSATVSPAAPSAGQSFSITGYQTLVNLPSSLASAAAPLQPTLTGSATAQIDASGATPATTPEGPARLQRAPSRVRCPPTGWPVAALHAGDGLRVHGHEPRDHDPRGLLGEPDAHRGGQRPGAHLHGLSQ